MYDPAMPSTVIASYLVTEVLLMMLSSEPRPPSLHPEIPSEPSGVEERPRRPPRHLSPWSLAVCNPHARTLGGSVYLQECQAL